VGQTPTSSALPRRTKLLFFMVIAQIARTLLALIQKDDLAARERDVFSHHTVLA